jgi:hypothetical protein
MADANKTLVYPVNAAMTLYLQTEQAQVRVTRWTERRIEIGMVLQLSMGWRYAADQDEAGVYVVAVRRAVVGGLSRADFQIAAPPDVYLSFKLKDCALTLADVSGTIELPGHGHDLLLNY